MRKYVLFLLMAVASASQAIVIPIPFFPTAPALIETFDTTAPGAYMAFPVFGGLGGAARIGTAGLLNVGPPSPFVTAPNGMFGRGVDVNIKINGQMRRFGGFFRSTNFILTPPTIATFKFYDSSNVLIGVGAAPISPAWSWIGFGTIPKWSRVEIFGNGSSPGYVAMDQLRMRPM